MIHLRGGSASSVRRTVLSHEQLNAHNTFERPGTVVPRSEKTDLQGAEIRCTLKPASVTRLDIALA